MVLFLNFFKIPNGQGVIPSVRLQGKIGTEEFKFVITGDGFGGNSRIPRSNRCKTIQELLRHATFKVTADTYAQAVTPVKREAHAKIAKLILAEVPAAKPVTPTIQ